MKVLKQWSLGVLFLLSFSNLQAQYREVGLVTSASMGIMYGPVLDARPVYKWGKSIARVSTIRAERTYMNYSRYQDNNYLSVSSGFFAGQEWRKPMADRLYFVHGPEIGTYYSSSINYTNIAPSLRYQFGALYQVNERFNIALSTPMSFTTSFGKSDGQWNQSAFNIGLFNENNLLTLTYVFKNQTTE
ncbi:MAG: hypothetical protein P8I47_05590 [Schleiferiaceae bacterium]|nr:hypothetical protein [Schleiferiaceae bacterium]